MGINLDRTVSWNNHINTVAKKASNISAFLQRNLHQLPRKSKAQSYQTLVRPLMEYACTIWDPHTKENINKLEAVQRRSARFVYNDFRLTTSVTPMLNELNWEPLQERRAQYKVIMMYRIMHGLVDIPTTHLTPQTTLVRGHMYSQSVTLQVSSVTLQVKILENQITQKTKVTKHHNENLSTLPLP